jgi:hypothetical protein
METDTQRGLHGAVGRGWRSTLEGRHLLLWNSHKASRKHYGPLTPSNPPSSPKNPLKLPTRSLVMSMKSLLKQPTSHLKPTSHKSQEAQMKSQQVVKS